MTNAAWRIWKAIDSACNKKYIYIGMYIIYINTHTYDNVKKICFRISIIKLSKPMSKFDLPTYIYILCVCVYKMRDIINMLNKLEG